MNHRPRKRFGQHFLTAPETIDRIVAAIAPAEGETIVEIGPGQAAITEPLARLATRLHAIEFDRDLARSLRERFAACENVTIHEADALKFDFSTLGRDLRLVGNLPYNISTPLLFHLLAFREQVTDMHFMLQKEVVDRICAAPGSRDFGRLTVMLGCHIEAVPLFDVPPSAFSPPPRVTSTVVRMRPLAPGHYDLRNDAALDAVVRLAFSRRRKTLRNAVAGLAESADIEAVGLDPGARPEQVAIEDWVALANRLSLNG
ncbi:MAG: 16S rRNA (adenine(1518)-N(6)/adenine(1519)-N(6))-dimethyltransferase RsmA [Gammaproteobacteria bacterium]|nr:16S rRNA (adenine(1518)-N(6)/adenine(1519)-N(6))-dimethyltransferase RsmA [Gammaproteobacteria bacterium]